MLTIERLKEVLKYNPKTGSFLWRVGPLKGKRAGSKDSKTRRVKIQIDGRFYRANRLAWLYMMGEWPKHHIDHRNEKCWDNSWDNLRDIPNSVNQQNKRKARRSSKTKVLGVTKRGTRYRAQIGYQKRVIHLGWFGSTEEAYQAYVQAKRKLHAGCTL